MEKSTKVGENIIRVISCVSCPHYRDGEESGECLKDAEFTGVAFTIKDRFVIDPTCPLMDFDGCDPVYICECGKTAHLLIVDDCGVEKVQCTNCFFDELEISTLDGHKPGHKVIWN